MEQITLTIGGMTCGGCVATVTRVLRAVPGVTSVEVSLEQGRAVVRHDAATAPVEALRAAVEDAGFDAG